MDLTQDMNPAELASLLHFYADAGVEWLVEEEAIDQIAVFAEQKAARQAIVESRASGQTANTGQAARHNGSSQDRQRSAPIPVATAPVTMPDEHAVTEARLAAEGAQTLEDLKTAIETFAGCNLKTSARSTILAVGTGSDEVMVIGGAPSGDDDRDGLPFSGRAGQLLERMLLAIGLSRESVWLSTVLPWRPPGDRPPSVQEVAICRPFIERQIELTRPKAVLLLGNLAARTFFGDTETIHRLRGQWRDIACGSYIVPAQACLHPLDLMAAPAGKALAWQDLQDFQRRLTSTQTPQN